MVEPVAESNADEILSQSNSAMEVDPEHLRCRFYRQDFPEENDLVMTIVIEIQDNGAYVVLPEYNNIQGLVPFTEVTRKRVKNVNRLIKIGKQEIMIVVRVDKDKGYIDLSKKKVNAEEAGETEKYFKKAKIVHNIFKAVAIELKQTLESIYEKFGWDLYDHFNHALDALQLLNTNPESVLKKIDIEEDEKLALLKAVKSKMAPRDVKIRAEFKMSCMRRHGVEAIRQALIEAKKAVSEEGMDFKFKLIAPPKYVVEVSTQEREKAIAKMKQAFVVLRDTINKFEGNFKKMSNPTVVGAHDDDPAELLRNQPEEESGEESNEEGMDIDLEEKDKEEDKKDDEEEDLE